MPNDVRMQAEAELQQIDAAFAVTSHRLVKGDCGQRSQSYVTWNGREVELEEYTLQKFVALKGWSERWQAPLSAAGITATFSEAGSDLRIYLHDERAAAAAAAADDPWKPEPPSVESSATELQKIALYKPLPPDDRWTLARVAREYPEACATVLTSLTKKQQAVAKAYLWEGLSQWETADRCGMANPQRVSEVVRRIRGRFEDAGLPEPQPPLSRATATPDDGDDDPVDFEDGADEGPVKMLPADPKARRRQLRRLEDEHARKMRARRA